MTWEIVAAVTPATGLLGIAIWRFARLEAQVRHQARCNRLVARSVFRLKRILVKHLKEKVQYD